MHILCTCQKRQQLSFPVALLKNDDYHLLCASRLNYGPSDETINELIRGLGTPMRTQLLKLILEVLALLHVVARA